MCLSPHPNSLFSPTLTSHGGKDGEAGRVVSVVCVCVCVCVCVSVFGSREYSLQKEREKARRKRINECMHVCVHACVFVYVCECVCVRDRYSVCVCSRRGGREKISLHRSE